MEVKIVNLTKHKLPEYSTILSAGMDIRANLSNPITLSPMDRKVIPTGLFIELPSGYEAQIRPRSGLAIKNGITVLNSPGTIDADYRGEIGVILIIASYVQVKLLKVANLDVTKRGSGGFGHTGKA
jgi:dUTP pyrophosphatase